MWQEAIRHPRHRRRSPAERSTARRPSGCSGCPSRVWPKRCAAPRRPSPALTSSRSPPACGAARSKWSPATSRTRRRCTRELTQLLRDRHGQQLYSEDGSHGRRSGRAVARRPPDSDGGILHRGAAGGAADRPARVVRLCDGRRGELLQRGESAAARCRPGTDRSARRGVRAGGRGDGGGRAAALRCRYRGRDHRNRRPGRGNAGKAGGNGLLHRDARRRPDGHPDTAAAREPVGHPGALDDGGDAPAAAHARAAPRIPSRSRHFGWEKSAFGSTEANSGGVLADQRQGRDRESAPARSSRPTRRDSRATRPGVPGWAS